MKIAIGFLDYERHDFTKIVLKNIAEAGYPFDLFTVQKKGIAAALNEIIDKTREYDAVCFCANDILMPSNFLIHMIKYAEAIEESGMIGIHTVQPLPEVSFINGIPIHRIFTAFGNVMLTRKVIDSVGYFNEKHDPYGMQDADYAFRLNKLGFINYYIPNLRADHIGHDVGQQTEYRLMKDEGLKKAEAIYNELCFEYDKSENYTIFERQMI
jgi:glycosyltransferase involved in cell wall biosynthesis